MHFEFFSLILFCNLFHFRCKTEALTFLALIFGAKSSIYRKLINLFIGIFLSSYILSNGQLIIC